MKRLNISHGQSCPELALVKACIGVGPGGLSGLDGGFVPRLFARVVSKPVSRRLLHTPMGIDEILFEILTGVGIFY
jgi:hypothetical protein